MPRPHLVLLTLLLGPAAPVRAQQLTVHPDSATLVLADVRRFSRALGELSAVADTQAVLRAYLAAATPGLRTYAARYQVTGSSIAAALARAPADYAALAAFPDRFREHEPALRTALHRLRELYPGVAYPPTYFVVGHLGAGGMVSPEGVIVAAERFARDPYEFVPLILHELAHFQQAKEQGVETYRAIYGDSTTLLKLALREGSAELIAELTAGRPINVRALAYLVDHEATLWRRFRADMGSRDPGDWMFARPANGDRPADLGYAMGHRIARAYYDRAADKARALLDILRLTDFAGFLDLSGYGADRP